MKITDTHNRAADSLDFLTCPYCTGPLPPEGHELCQDEMDTSPLMSCPDSDPHCGACYPEETP